MTDEWDEEELGSRCIWCGESFLAHVGDWCREDKDNRVTNTPVGPLSFCDQESAGSSLGFYRAQAK